MYTVIKNIDNFVGLWISGWNIEYNKRIKLHDTVNIQSSQRGKGEEKAGSDQDENRIDKLVNLMKKKGKEEMLTPVNLRND